MALNAILSNYGTATMRMPRDNEYDAFSRVTNMLRRSSANKDRLAEIDAVRKNNQLWTILAEDLSSPGNALPDELKIRLLSLAIFSLRHGDSVLAHGKKTNALIDINMSIMKGLRGEVKT